MPICNIGKAFMHDSTKKERTAKDSPRRLFFYFYAACWLAWMLVAVLTAWALFQVNADRAPFDREQVVSGFWWITYFCIGLPLGARALMWWVERRDM